MKTTGSNALRLTLAAAATLCLFSGPANAADKVKVGMLSTLSGPGAGLGIDIRDGFNLALKHSGGKLGGLPAEVIVADDQARRVRACASVIHVFALQTDRWCAKPFEFFCVDGHGRVILV